MQGILMCKGIEVVGSIGQVLLMHVCFVTTSKAGQRLDKVKPRRECHDCRGELAHCQA